MDERRERNDTPLTQTEEESSGSLEWLDQLMQKTALALAGLERCSSLPPNAAKLEMERAQEIYSQTQYAVRRGTFTAEQIDLLATQLRLLRSRLVTERSRTIRTDLSAGS